MTQTPSDPGFCLIAEAKSGADWLARVGAALDESEAGSLILTTPSAGPIDPAVARPLVEMAQQKGIAALLANDVATARAVGADGVHLSWRPEIEDAYEAARNTLGPDAIVGADAGTSRHDAMSLGESGADYVAFGRQTDVYGADAARETQQELVAWWAEMFVVPVLALDIESTEDITDLTAAGADFIAARLPSDDPDGGVKAWAAKIVAALKSPADAP